MWIIFKNWFMTTTVSYSAVAAGLLITGLVSLVGIIYLITECF
ncbi:Uncharacterized protein YR821_0987 [Yersinia ruckeri]|uniref:Uncharacterized protein n=1 Tax=Yersinia ruckeri TaxID=29486 RepID=A0A0A8VEP2_YERRU|nr:Uncharacterized protein YR821_0987 [Yersinia ruckeri]CEK26813.1 hypothetical protein CSF007_5230 [Yersinia ruckeri]